MRLLGVESMPIAAFIALFTGAVIALLASYSLRGATVPLYFIGTSAEKGDHDGARAGAHRAGARGLGRANIAAELGTMRVTEQVDALQTLAY
jgi:phospholipid/cholesterol/gamma-HCH transport system permease protein